MYIQCVLFIHSSIDGLLGGFYLLAIVSNVPMNINVQVFVLSPFFHLLATVGYIRCMPRLSNLYFFFMSFYYQAYGNPVCSPVSTSLQTVGNSDGRLLIRYSNQEPPVDDLGSERDHATHVQHLLPSFNQQ